MHSLIAIYLLLLLYHYYYALGEHKDFQIELCLAKTIAYLMQNNVKTCIRDSWFVGSLLVSPPSAISLFLPTWQRLLLTKCTGRPPRAVLPPNNL